MTLIFSRYTQLGLLRLLTNKAAMGKQTLSLKEAWEVFDRWLGDPRVKFYTLNREDWTPPFAERPCLFPISRHRNGSVIVIFSHIRREADAQLATFDRALAKVARENGCRVVVPN